MLLYESPCLTPPLAFVPLPLASSDFVGEIWYSTSIHDRCSCKNDDFLDKDTGLLPGTPGFYLGKNEQNIGIFSGNRLDLGISKEYTGRVVVVLHYDTWSEFQQKDAKGTDITWVYLKLWCPKIQWLILEFPLL